MPVTEPPLIAELVRETQQRLGLTQEQLAQELGVYYQSVNRWEGGRTKPLPLAQKQIQQLLRQGGERGQDLLVKHFADKG